MPIFEYKCAKCGKVSEFLEISSPKPDKQCGFCSSTELVKQFSTFSPQIKEGPGKKCFGCSDGACPHAGH